MPDGETVYDKCVTKLGFVYKTKKGVDFNKATLMYVTLNWTIIDYSRSEKSVGHVCQLQQLQRLTNKKHKSVNDS